MTRLRGQGLSFAEIGRRVGLTGEAVRRSLNPAVGRIRRCAVCGAARLQSLLCNRCERSGGKTFAQRLKLRRVLAGLTQSQLAALAGVSKTTIHKLETGQQRPSRALLTVLRPVFPRGPL